MTVLKAPLVPRDEPRRADDRICSQRQRTFRPGRSERERTDDKVIAPPRCKRPCEPHVAHLNRRRPRRKNLVPRALRVAREVDEDVDPVVDDPVDDLLSRVVRDVEEVLRFGFDLESVRGLVARRGRVAEDVELLSIVEAKDALHEVRKRVVAKVAARGEGSLASVHSRKPPPLHSPRNVADVDDAVEGRRGRRVDVRRKPRLVESVVRDAKAGAMRDEASFASADGVAEGVEG